MGDIQGHGAAQIDEHPGGDQPARRRLRRETADKIRCRMKPPHCAGELVISNVEFCCQRTKAFVRLPSPSGGTAVDSRLSITSGRTQFGGSWTPRTNLRPITFEPTRIAVTEDAVIGRAL